MPAKKYRVTLTADERGHLDALLRKGKAAALVLTRARILLTADQADGGPAWADDRMADALDVGERTIRRVRERLVERGSEACPQREPQDRPSRERTRGGAAEARLIALACSDPPDGRAEWAVPPPADTLVERAVVDAIPDETVRRAMKETGSSRGSRSRGASRPGRAGRSPPPWRT